MSPSIPPSEPPSEPSSNPEASVDVRRARIIVTAGPTHEPIDGVRYLANRSSGRMGISIAEAAAASGLPTTLLLGPVQLHPDENSGIDVQRFQTTAELQALLEQEWPSHDILFMAAAVADYRLPAPDLRGKHRRSAEGCTLELEATPDLLAGLSKTTNQLTVGWALEPREELAERARTKLLRKKLDVIVANPLETIGAARIEPLVLIAGDDTASEVETPEHMMDKTAFAGWLVELACSLR